MPKMTNGVALVETWRLERETNRVGIQPEAIANVFEGEWTAGGSAANPTVNLVEFGALPMSFGVTGLNISI